mmetsp:Transcript_25578/g.34193  ORF Transcript_25578/g.34193 Transcript_25578/m.34193 type:complete len:85 (+) Transcript_25578:18-272(+)
MVEALESGVLESDRLPDACNDRKVDTVRAPPIVPLSKERVFPGGPTSPNSEINLELVKNYLFEGGRLSKDCLLEIMKRVRPVLS